MNHKLVVGVFVFVAVVVASASEVTHEERALAKLGVSYLGPGHTFVRIKKLRKQVTVSYS